MSVDAGKERMSLGSEQKRKEKSGRGRDGVALGGESLNFVLQSSVQGENKWREYDLNPIKNKTGDIIGLSAFSRDITDRKNIEAEVQQIQADLESEKSLFDSFLNHTPDFVYFKDKESRFIRNSKSMVKLFGVKSEKDLLGKSDFDFFTEEHAKPAFDDEMGIIKSGESIIDLIEKETYDDGRVRWVTTTKMPLKNLTHEIIGTFGVSRDISNFKKTEIDQKAGQLRLENMLEYTQHSYLILHDQEVKYVSKAFSTLTGYKKEDLVAHHISTFINKDSIRDLENLLLSKIQEKGAAIELYLTHKTEGLIKAKATLFVIPREDGIEETVIWID